MADTDHDGINDGDEVLKYKTNPTDPDTDKDPPSIRAEMILGSLMDQMTRIAVSSVPLPNRIRKISPTESCTEPALIFQTSKMISNTARSKKLPQIL